MEQMLLCIYLEIELYYKWRIMRTCKICKYCKEYTIQHHLEKFDTYYTCKIFNNIINFKRIRSLFCRWFSYNGICKKALQEQMENYVIKIIQR